jgi:hypothetical protein
MEPSSRSDSSPAKYPEMERHPPGDGPGGRSGGVRRIVPDAAGESPEL